MPEPLTAEQQEDLRFAENPWNIPFRAIQRDERTLYVSDRTHSDETTFELTMSLINDPGAHYDYQMRVLACLNACAGVSTAQLQRLPPGNVYRALAVVNDHISNALSHIEIAIGLLPETLYADIHASLTTIQTAAERVVNAHN